MLLQCCSSIIACCLGLVVLVLLLVVLACLILGKLIVLDHTGSNHTTCACRAWNEDVAKPKGKKGAKKGPSKGQLQAGLSLAQEQLLMSTLEQVRLLSISVKSVFRASCSPYYNFVAWETRSREHGVQSGHVTPGLCAQAGQ